MNYLNGIGLENFGVFKEKQWFDFAPITILTGTNSSGKSSLINLIEIFSDADGKESKSIDNLVDDKKTPALQHLNFLNTNFYSRKLSKRLGDFSTLQNNRKKGLKVFFQDELSSYKKNVEIAYTYMPTNTELTVGKLTQMLLSICQIIKQF